MLYLHFTDRASATAIRRDGHLELSRTIVNAVYAAPVGGVNVPGVQHARTGDDVALLFSAAVDPDSVFPEEVIWHRRTPLKIHVRATLSGTAGRKLLDGAANIPDDGIHHPDSCRCEACTVHYETLAGIEPANA